MLPKYLILTNWQFITFPSKTSQEESETLELKESKALGAKMAIKEAWESLEEGDKWVVSV